MRPRPYKARANSSRKKAESLSLDTRRRRLNAEPQYFLSAPALRSEDQSCRQLRSLLENPHRVSDESRRGSRVEHTLAWERSAPNDEGSLTHDSTEVSHNANCSSQIGNRDSTHANVVRRIKFLGGYHVVRQCVTPTCDFSSSPRRLTAPHEVPRSRGPDNGKPVERPGRKAPRLKRAKSRYASRAAERFPRRST